VRDRAGSQGDWGSESKPGLRLRSDGEWRDCLREEETAAAAPVLTITWGLDGLVIEVGTSRNGREDDGGGCMAVADMISSNSDDNDDVARTILSAPGGVRG
jgi:hypothetical protein